MTMTIYAVVRVYHDDFRDCLDTTFLAFFDTRQKAETWLDSQIDPDDDDDPNRHVVEVNVQ